MIENIVDRLDVRASIREIPHARPGITAEGIEIPDAPSSGKADGIDEPAEGIDVTAARMEIHDDGTNIIDAMTNEHDDRLDVIDAMRDEPARPTDLPAKGGEVPDEVIDRTEGRMTRNANRTLVQCSRH